MWESRLERLQARTLGGGVTLVVARGPLARTAGLAGLRELPARTGLLIPRCRSVHTFGMRFSLDLIWLHADGSVAGLTAGVAPGRLASNRSARAVVESRAGEGGAVLAALLHALRPGYPLPSRA